MTTEDFQKVKPIKYDLGNDGYIMTVQSVNGIYCWGYIAGEHIQFEDKDLKAIEGKIADYSSKANINHTNKAIRFEEIALRMKENGLETFVQTDGDNKTDLNWIKD